MKHLRLLLITIMLLALIACGTPSTTESPTAAPPTAAPSLTPRTTPSAEPTSAPTAVPQATAVPTVPPESQLPLATLTAELSATVVASLPPTPTPEPGVEPFPGIEGISAQPLKVPEGWPPLWMVATHGMSLADPSQKHFVAVYTRDGSDWKELDRAELEHDDYLDPASLTQVEIDPQFVWLEAQGGAGAHSGCYDLLRFDGQQLHNEASSCSSSPGAGGLEDINSDGVPEVLLDATDYYIFCYACGVRLVNYTVLRWDGQQMVEAMLTTMPDGEPADLRQLTNQAVELADHGFWKDAEATISQTQFLQAYDETAAWDAALIRLVARARAEQAASGAYPLLDNLFYGDYAAALDVLRAEQPAQLFGTDIPLVKGTTAEGFEAQLTYAVTQTTGTALELKPDLAAAYFLRGWAVHLTDPDNPSVLADIERAAQLDPKEALFSDSVVYLKQ
jgi:hypothetical protein